MHRPRILWRTLHQVKTLRWHPQIWHRQLDAIGRAAVGELVGESEAAVRGGGAWKEWVMRMRPGRERRETREREEEAKEMGLGRRLKGESESTKA